MDVDELSRRTTVAAKGPQAAPIIVMAYTGSGAAQLRPVLSAFPGLTCTAGTGILPLCHNAVSAWRAVDGRVDEGLSPLAVASVKALSAALVTAILAREGGARWCEFTAAPSAAAETFVRLYPQARFLTVHRRADTAVRAIIGASRWGLEGPEFAPFVAASPASSVAALASYWVTHTTWLLDFEQSHRESCFRVRIEDLTANASQTRSDIGDFLSLDGGVALSWLTNDADLSDQASADPSAAGIPLAQIPPSLLAELNQLHTRLGYSPVTAADGASR